jgi:hypothetical protein
MQIKIFTWKSIQNTFLTLLRDIKEKDKIKTMSSILHIANNHNGNPTPPLAKPLSGTNWELNEFRIDLQHELIRINYFIDYEYNFLVILNWYIKPDGRNDSNNYNKAKGKIIEKIVQLSIFEALELKKLYTINNNDYELLN